jgi:hypothetical protein
MGIHFNSIYMAVATESLKSGVPDFAGAITSARETWQNLCGRVAQHFGLVESDGSSSQRRGGIIGAAQGILDRSRSTDNVVEVNPLLDSNIAEIGEIHLLRREVLAVAAIGATAYALTGKVEQVQAQEGEGKEVDCSSLRVAGDYAINGLEQLEPVVAGVEDTDSELVKRWEVAGTLGLFSLGSFVYGCNLWRYDTDGNPSAGIAKKVLPPISLVGLGFAIAVGIKGNNLYSKLENKGEELSLLKEGVSEALENLFFLQGIEGDEDEGDRVIQIRIPVASIDESNDYRRNDIFPEDPIEVAYRAVVGKGEIVGLGKTIELEVSSSDPAPFIIKSITKQGKDLVIHGVTFMSTKDGNVFPTVATAVIKNAEFDDLPKFIPQFDQTDLGQNVAKIIGHDDIYAIEDGTSIAVSSEDSASQVRSKLMFQEEESRFSRIKKDATRALLLDDNEVKVVSVLKNASGEVVFIVGDFEPMNSTVEYWDDVAQNGPCLAICGIGIAVASIVLAKAWQRK